MAPGADLTAHPPPAHVRIPKLKYRNPLPVLDTSGHPDPRHNTDRELVDTTSESPATPSSNAPSDRPSFDTASLTSSSLASAASSVSSSNDSKASSQKATKKKKGSMLGFLSLKEPSQIALEQYAEAQRKQALEHSSGSSTPTSRPDTSYSTKKLPRSVPKVNSKWDGVPESVKHRHSRSGESNKTRPSESSQQSPKSQDSSKSRITSMSWNGSKLSVMTDGTRNPPNSLASAANSVAHLPIRDGARSISPSPSTATLPEMSYYFPQPLIHDAQSAQPVQATTYNASVAEAPPRPSESSSEFYFQSDQYSERADSPASSADSMDTVVRDTADVIFQKLNDRPHKSIWGDEPTAQPPDASNNAAVPESHDFLFSDQSQSDPVKADSPMATTPMASPSVSHYAPARPVQNFSRPTPPSMKSPPARSMMMPSYRTSRTGSELPTLYEASIASTESDGTIQDDDEEEEDDDDTYSIAPSTIAPSILSSHWHDSPRERLGLGGRLRMNGGLPWDDRKELSGKPKKHRLSMFSRGAARS